MKRILIAVFGKTPQIITETLYALHEQGRFPDRVVILTTEAGRDMCRAHLLHPEHGNIARLLADIGRPAGSRLLCETDVHTPSSRARRPVMDIETEEDSRCFFELCLEIVFNLARAHNDELLFSIAGGRKTMSAALALAAQCYARPQDAMFHVLVPPEQESNPQFFYPRPPLDGVRITLTPVPFFRMRNQLPPALLRSAASLDALNYACMPQTLLRLKINICERSLSCHGHTLRLPPALFAVYAFFALQNAPCPDGATACPAECRSCAMAWADIEPRRNDILRLYQMVEIKALARGRRGILHLSADNFRSALAKIKKILAQTFGEITGARLSIVSIKKNNVAKYSLRLPRRQISVEPQRCDH